MNATPLFYEGDPAHANYLASRDARLARVMAAVGPVRRRIWPEPYAALLRIVIGQQISAKAQDAVWRRFCSAFPHFDPEALARIDPEQICQCGISRRKAGYMQGIAAEFASGRLNAEQMAQMSDEDLQQALGRLKGIGTWTVEMLLIFTFCRPNVLSFGDLAIQRSLRRLYGHERITREIFAKHLRIYTPCATLAGMYLWEMARLAPESVPAQT